MSFFGLFRQPLHPGQQVRINVTATGYDLISRRSDGSYYKLARSGGTLFAGPIPRSVAVEMLSSLSE
jgi:hypothetical protein